MSMKNLIAGSAALVLIAMAGCSVGTVGPGIGVASIPFPVSPYFQQGYEDLAFEKERYNKVAILGPVSEGECVALDPPSDDQVVRMLEKVRPVSGGSPFLETTYRNIKGIEKHKIADYLDPPRVVPLIGPAQLHHAHYKCIVYFEEVTHVGWPIPYTIRNEDAIEVLYIDLDHFHRVGGPENIPGGM